jgi:hypothetical protein
LRCGNYSFGATSRFGHPFAIARAASHDVTGQIIDAKVADEIVDLVDDDVQPEPLEQPETEDDF